MFDSTRKHDVYAKSLLAEIDQKTKRKITFEICVNKITQDFIHIQMSYWMMKVTKGHLTLMVREWYLVVRSL